MLSGKLNSGHEEYKLKDFLAAKCAVTMGRKLNDEQGYFTVTDIENNRFYGRYRVNLKTKSIRMRIIRPEAN